MMVIAGLYDGNGGVLMCVTLWCGDGEVMGDGRRVATLSRASKKSSQTLEKRGLVGVATNMTDTRRRRRRLHHSHRRRPLSMTSMRWWTDDDGSRQVFVLGVVVTWVLTEEAKGTWCCGGSREKWIVGGHRGLGGKGGLELW
jgi:hypothetical protein